MLANSRSGPLKKSPVSLQHIVRLPTQQRLASMAGIQPGVHIPLLSPPPFHSPAVAPGWMGVRCSLGGKREGERGGGGGCGWGKGALKASRGGGGGGGGGEMYLRQFSFFSSLFLTRGKKENAVVSFSSRDICEGRRACKKKQPCTLSPLFLSKQDVSISSLLFCLLFFS